MSGGMSVAKDVFWLPKWQLFVRKNADTSDKIFELNLTPFEEEFERMTWFRDSLWHGEAEYKEENFSKSVSAAVISPHVFEQ